MRRIVIVGGSSPIAQELTKVLGEDVNQNKCKLFISYRSEIGAAKLRPRVTLSGRHVGNLETETDCCNVIENAAKAMGGINEILIFVGGISRASAWNSVTQQEWLRDYNTNFVLPALLTKHALRHMDPANDNLVLLFSTGSVVRSGSSDSMPYVLAKTALESFGLWLGQSLPRGNPRILVARLGLVETGFHIRYKGMDADAWRARVGMVPVGRAASPKEVAQILYFLLSKAGSFVSGRPFSIMGGE